VSAARNAGIRASEGTYLRFIDADDYFPPDSTTALLDLINGSEDRIGVGATRWCDADLAPILDCPAGCPRHAAVPYLLLRCTPMIPSVLLPRSIIELAGPWDPAFRVCEDWDFLLRAFEHGDVAETHLPVTWYRNNESSASHDVADTWHGTVLGAERYFDRHPGQRGTALDRKVKSALDLTAAELEWSDRPWRSRRFWRALARDPSALRTFQVRQIRPRLARLKSLLRQRRPEPTS
jgi:glycosyltransferase involved in cell wall biosynthesis